MKEKVLYFLQEQVKQEHIPGAVIHISHHSETILQEAIGYRSIYPVKQPMNINTVFDLASLTKVVATTPAILKLIDAGEILLDNPVKNFLPEFENEGKGEIKVRHLLTHTSGLPAHRQYYAESLTTAQIMNRIYQEPLVSRVGEKVIYSDLGFITLYKIVEVVVGQAFEDFVQKEIFDPLHMRDTGFNVKLDRDRFAPTEPGKGSTEYKLGLVHDENAESMGGISGHAGLFSTVNDLAKFASMVEQEGVYAGKKILSRSVLELARRNYTPKDQEYRGLGWMLKGPLYAPCGDLFSKDSYGHTGYTGTSIWFDPELRLHVILLTNRVHIEKKLEILNLRPKLHNLIRSHLF